MSTVITIDDALAQRLEYQARAQDISLEQWAAEVLERGFELEVGSPRWLKVNQRRLALLQQRERSGLTPGDEAELAALQHLTGRAMRGWDEAMMADLERRETIAKIHE